MKFSKGGTSPITQTGESNIVDAVPIAQDIDGTKREFWIPTNALDEKRLIMVLTKMVRHYLMTDRTHERCDVHAEIRTEIETGEALAELQEQVQPTT